MKKYIKPFSEIVTIINNNVLCLSSTATYYHDYTCPIRKGLKCDDYSKCVQEWKNIVEYAAKHGKNRTFITGPEEQSCPNKCCSVFIEWQKQQQKTR